MSELNAAFIYKHSMTGEVLVMDMERSKHLEQIQKDAPFWQLIHSVNAVETLAFIVGLTARQRNKYIKQLTEKEKNDTSSKIRVDERIDVQDGRACHPVQGPESTDPKAMGGSSQGYPGFDPQGGQVIHLP